VDGETTPGEEPNEPDSPNEAQSEPAGAGQPPGQDPNSAPPPRGRSHGPAPWEALERLDGQWEDRTPIEQLQQPVATLALTTYDDPRGWDYIGALVGASPREVARACEAWLEAQLAADAIALGQSLRPRVNLVPSGRLWSSSARCLTSSSSSMGRVGLWSRRIYRGTSKPSRESRLPIATATQVANATSSSTIRSPLSVDPPTKKLIVEAVYGVIEVKSRLTLAELRDAHKKVVQVKSLNKKAWEGPPNQVNALSYDRSWMASPVHGFVVAFAGTKLKSLRKELERLNATQEVHMRVDSVWVLDSGFIVNWKDGSESIEPLPDYATRLRAGKTSNPVALFITHLNQLYQQIETPPIRFEDYGVHPLRPDQWVD
jgi:hypothetical protein